MILILLYFLLGPCLGSYFEPGYDHHYVYNAESDYLGTQNITTTVKFHVRQLERRDDYRLMQLEMDSIVQFSRNGIFADNPHKWDLMKQFMFRLLPHGIISLVHFHPDDPEEAVLLKKALASTLSANFKISNEETWNYTSRDIDHLGTLQHQYIGKRLSSGVSLHRHHRSVDKVERIHQKTLHLDSQGTIHKVEAEDHIIIENRLPEREKRIPMEGEYVINDYSEGEIGPIHAKAKVDLRLVVKRKQTAFLKAEKQILHDDDIIFKKDLHITCNGAYNKSDVNDKSLEQIEKKVDIGSVSVNLTRALSCIHNYTDKSDENRTLCVNNLRNALLSVKTVQLIAFCDKIFRKQCKVDDVLCKDERYLFLDILSRNDDPDIQRLIVNHFLKSDHNDDEALRRIFIHVAALTRPTEELISCIARKCFGENGTQHGSRNLTKTTQRACLALGNIARTISSTNMTRAEELMAKVASWIHAQDSGVKFRYTRSVGEYNPAVNDDHMLSKMALLHTLGNAGLESSKPHILMYLEPNFKHSAWRRAAIEATRHFHCRESAVALLTILNNDNIISVRKMALERYKKHPERNHMSEEEENIILSKSYTYPVVARVRRGLLDVLFEPIVDFLIALPEFHWKKEIGNAKIGASFGLDFVNKIHLRIALIQGFFRIDIHDRLFAEAHIGIINFQKYILLIDVCYKGHIEYNLNLLKDYVFDKTGNMIKEYDKLAQSIVSPIVQAAKGISNIFEGAKARQGVFGEITRSVKSIPTQMEQLVEASTEFVSKMNHLDGVPVFRHAKELANKIQAFAESVKSDAVEFYNRVSDAALVSFPYSEQEMVNALNSIIKVQKKISDHPRQGFAEIDQAKLRMKMAMSRLIEAKTKLTETLSADQGSMPEWLSVSEDMNVFKDKLQELRGELREHITLPLDVDSYNLQMMTQKFVEESENTLQLLSKNMDDVSDSVFPFMKSVKTAMDDMKLLKVKYDALQHTTTKVKTDVQKVFGTKFHTKFPSQRRICDSRCGCGVWPAKTGSKHLNNPGIDISLSRNSPIVMPVNGMVFRSGNSDELRIVPVVDDMKEFEIFLGNVEIKIPIDDRGTYVKSGGIIASPGGSNGCKDEYFHLAMKNSKSSHHIDPSSFVDNVDLLPKWKEECKEFTFKHIGVNDLGKLGKGFMDLLKKFVKRALEWVKTHVLDIIMKLLPDSPILGKIGKIAKAFLGIINSASNLGNMFADMGESGNTFGDFHSNMDAFGDMFKGVGELGKNAGILLTEVGVPEEITHGFSNFANVANLVGSGFDITGDLVGSGADFESGNALGIAGDLLKDTGEIAGDLKHVLNDAGISNHITDALGIVQTVTNGAESVMDTINKVSSGDELSGDFSGIVNTMSSTVSDISGTASHLLHEVGVSSDVTDVFDKIQKGADDVSGIVDSMTNFDASKNGDASVLDTIQSVSKNAGAFSGRMANFLNDIGVSKENTKILRHIQTGANGLAGFTSSIESTVNSFSDTSGNVFAESSERAFGIADVSSSLKHFLSGVGVSGDVTNVLGDIEMVANTVNGVSHTAGTIVSDIKDIHPGLADPKKILSSISGVAKSVENGISDMSELFSELGMSNEILDAISQIKKSSKDFSGLAASVEKTFGDISNITKSGGINKFASSLSKLASNVKQGAASIGKFTTVLRNKTFTESPLQNDTSSSGISDIVSKFKNVETVAKAITETFKGSPIIARSPDGGLLGKVNVGAMTVDDFLSSANDAADEIRSKLPEIDTLISTLVNATENVPLQSLISASYETFQDIANQYDLTLDGDKTSMTSMVYLLPGKVCDHFQHGIARGSQHTCIPFDNCMGLQCQLHIPLGFSSKVISFSILINSETRTLLITVDNVRREIKIENGLIQIPKMTIEISGGFQAVLSGSMELTENFELLLSSSIKTCIPNVQRCFPRVKILDNLKVNLNFTTTSEYPKRKKRMALMSGLFSLSSIKKLSLNGFASALSGRNIQTGSIFGSMNSASGGLKDQLNMNSESGMPTGSVSKEFMKTKDKRDLGDDPEKLMDLVIFSVKYTWGVGPIRISLEFGAGGAIGMSISSDVRSKSGTSVFVIAPWISGEVYGGVSVSLLIASGGLRLIGYIMKTRFPYTTETYQSKSPVEVVQKLDVELIPLELKLCAWAKVFGATVFESCFWKWSCPPIKWNIFTRRKFGKRGKPPTFANGCKIKQLQGRHPTDTAFHLETYPEDEGSDLKLSYAIGTNPGGTDVLSWQNFQGTSLVSPARLENGIPLHWTVKARNTEGLETVAQCSLQTYDNTNPDGRVEATYPYSSHPGSLSGSVMILDDSPLIKNNLKALGYSPGPYGSEVIPWYKLDLHSSSERKGIYSDLKHFSQRREGKLTAIPVKSFETNDETVCATACIDYGTKCVSFDFESHTQTCDLHSVLEGPFASLQKTGTYSNYERIDVGFNSFISYKNVSLDHGAVYYINVVVTNTLGYKSVLSTKGTIIDFTPPEPGHLGLKILDTMKADGCKAAITQRCKDVTWKKNHRVLIDGVGSRTIFNGHHPSEEQKYTMSNHYISANWDGFKDRESGIYGFTWAAGRKPCGYNIVGYVDPHASFSNPKFWTYTGYKKNIHLEDGKYYVTVQALNNIVHGGSLVTTVCHSTPLIVDTSPPIFHQVPDIMFDEDFDILAVYYNVSDDGSGIQRIDFGLGKSKHDIEVRGYVRRNHMNRFDPFFVVENLDLKPGVPAWIRVRAVNNVDQFASGHAPQPIMVDKTPPIVGVVSDGDRLQGDLQYQHETDKICAQWTNFFDPESGIRKFMWGVGSGPQLDDISQFKNVSHHTKIGCTDVILKHNTTYYSTVIAFNDALNSKHSNGSSDGVLIDVTPPKAGFVNDGVDLESDINFSSESATVHAVWNNFTDAESDIAQYNVNVFINKELKKSLNMKQIKILEDHSLSLSHLDFVTVEVEATNGAELKNTQSSNGVLIDHTPPNVIMISDCLSGKGYQADDKTLFLRWKFEDEESDIKEYRILINRLEAGQKLKVWPDDSDYKTIEGISKESQTALNITVMLTSGFKYFAHFTAVNRADLSTTHESNGVVIDVTPPSLIKVHIGKFEEEEELDENGYILHDSPSAITISWKVRDFESSLETIFVAIGVEGNMQKILPWYEVDGKKASVLIDNLSMAPTLTSNYTYIVSVKAKNRAGLVSKTVRSRSIYVQKSNVPGLVFDGRNLLKDEDFQIDKTSVAMSFIGFESEACNIFGYDWAVGSSPFSSDILPYTSYGIVMKNETFGYAQIHLTLYEAETYFMTVRARTGYKCREAYILASSDGIRVDSSPPTVSFTRIEKNMPMQSRNTVVFQKNLDSVDLYWDISDLSSIMNQSVVLRKEPQSKDVWQSNDPSLNSIPAGSVHLETGETLFLTINSTDSAGLSSSITSNPIIIDNTIPELVDFKCTPTISVVQSLVKCSWVTFVENESRVAKIQIAVGNQSSIFNIMNFTTVPKFQYSWFRDLKQVLLETDVTNIFVSIKLSNILEDYLKLEFPIVVDRSEPDGGQIYFVTSIKPGIVRKEKQECQQPTSFVDIILQNFEDKETTLHKFEIGLGTAAGITNVMKFITRSYSNYTFLNDLILPVGEMVYATVRVFNDVGLYRTVVSEPIAISPSPTLSVIDGYTLTHDEDFQHRTSLMGGKWIYSDLCRVIKAEWAIEDIAGNLVQNFTNIQGASNHFFSDELQLNNGKTYINIIRITDALQRTFLSRSDGIAVRIQPPDPGIVRDGPSDDRDYQASSSEISANWEIFGKIDGKDPTQTIIKYMIAIGNDRRYSITRSNIHAFVDVGLNTSYIFTNLNLTEKTVTYYVTVKAISLAGSSQESTSDGIRVGFRIGVIPGKVYYDRFQSITNKISVYWSDFVSDLGIREYYVAVGSSQSKFAIENADCTTIIGLDSHKYDVLSPRGVGDDTYVTIKNLQLKHGLEYFVSVIAEDEAGLCSVISGTSLTIDTTPPLEGKLFIGSFYNVPIVYVHENTTLDIHWEHGLDEESGIKMYVITLLSKQHCNSTEEIILTESEIVNETEHTFYQLNLESKIPYFVRMRIVNRAGLSRDITSVPIFVDMTSPLKGDVKPGLDWIQPKPFQSSQSQIDAVMAIARSKSAYECPRHQMFPFNSFRAISNFSSECVDITSEHLDIGIRHDDTLQKIIKGGVASEPFKIIGGMYSFKLLPLKGENMTTIIALAPSLNHVPFNFEEQHYFDSNYSIGNGSESRFTGIPQDYGVGITIAGYPREQNRKIILWSKDRYENRKRTMNYEIEELLDIEIELEGEDGNSGNEISWSVTYFINDEELVQFTDLKFQDEWAMFLLTHNENGFFPPVTDIFHPYDSVSRFMQINIPLNNDHACQYGKGFFDDESHLKEIWIGVSDSINKTDNIKPLQLFMEFCQPCYAICPGVCDRNCLEKDEFEIFPTTINNLTLLSSSNANKGIHNETFDTSNGSKAFDLYETPAYFINVKVVNLAGLDILIHSPAITIDTTAPYFEKVKCVDPEHSMTEPAAYKKSLQSLGAFWECSEDVGQIVKYAVSVGTSMNDTSVLNETEIGMNKTFRVDNLKGILRDFTTYYISVYAYNSAGLLGKGYCNVTVELHAPDVSQTVTSPLFGNPYLINPPPNVTFLSSGNNVGVQWIPRTSDVEFYEWQIGSNDGDDDIFPRVKVGTSKARSVAIVNGKMWLDNQNTNTTLAEYILKNWDNKSIAEAKRNAFFNIEPGKCIHMGLFAVSRSHLSTQVPVDANCFLRPKDHLVSFKRRKNHKISLTNGRFVDGALHNSSSSSMTIDINGSKGGISFGVLSKEDMTINYGSAGGPHYKSYIVNPSDSSSKTSRSLRRRITMFSNMSFFMSPTGDTDINRWIDFTISINTSDLTVSEIPALIVWNRTAEEWQLLDDNCVQNLHVDHVQSVLKGKICIGECDYERIKRQTFQTVTLKEPQHFALVTIKKELQNTSPIIRTTMERISEDGFLRCKIDWDDSENDNVILNLLQGPVHGYANITSDGILEYQPTQNFWGSDTVYIGITEIISGVKSSELAHRFNISFEILVDNVNDGPSVLFGSSSNETFYSKAQNKIEVILEAGDIEYFIGSFSAFDIDMNDSLTHQVYNNASNDMLFDLKETELPNPFLLESLNTSFSPSILNSFDLYLKLNTTAYGHVAFGLLVYDSAQWYSKAAWFEVFVLQNPCVNGHCGVMNPNGPDCNDKVRSISFSNYVCICDNGYEGQWCEIESNECVPNPCPLMYDCHDELASYTCEINPAKLVAILICLCIASVFIIFVYRKKKLTKERMKVSDFWGTTPPHQMAGPSGAFSKVKSLRQESPDSEGEDPVFREISRREHVNDMAQNLRLKTDQCLKFEDSGSSDVHEKNKDLGMGLRKTGGKYDDEPIDMSNLKKHFASKSEKFPPHHKRRPGNPLLENHTDSKHVNQYIDGFIPEIDI